MGEMRNPYKLLIRKPEGEKLRKHRRTLKDIIKMTYKKLLDGLDLYDLVVPWHCGA
jgi:hypothetical protein